MHNDSLVLAAVCRVTFIFFTASE